MVRPRSPFETRTAQEKAADSIPSALHAKAPRCWPCWPPGLEREPRGPVAPGACSGNRGEDDGSGEVVLLAPWHCLVALWLGAAADQPPPRAEPSPQAPPRSEER